jgi:uncharacterized protein
VPSTIVDTGPLVALIDRRDAHHAAAKRWFKTAKGPMVTNIAVLTEVLHLLGSVENQVKALDLAANAFEIDAATPTDLNRITAIMRKYRDRPADFADASLVALAERLKTDLIASADRDFAIYRTASNKPLRNTFFT